MNDYRLLLHVVLHQGDHVKAMAIFEKMKTEGPQPDLGYCVPLLYFYYLSTITKSLVLFHGAFALPSFYSLPRTYSTLVAGLVKLGFLEDALHYYYEMNTAGVVPE